MDLNDINAFSTPHAQQAAELSAINESVNKTKLANLIKLDPNIDEQTKTHILSFITGPHQIDHLFAGTAGALVAFNISRLLAMKKETQILLSLAGFGAGVIISNHLIKPQKGVVSENGTTQIIL